MASHACKKTRGDFEHADLSEEPTWYAGADRSVLGSEGSRGSWPLGLYRGVECRWVPPHRQECGIFRVSSARAVTRPELRTAHAESVNVRRQGEPSPIGSKSFKFSDAAPPGFLIGPVQRSLDRCRQPSGIGDMRGQFVALASRVADDPIGFPFQARVRFGVGLGAARKTCPLGRGSG